MNIFSSFSLSYPHYTLLRICWSVFEWYPVLFLRPWTFIFQCDILLWRPFCSPLLSKSSHSYHQLSHLIDYYGSFVLDLFLLLSDLLFKAGVCFVEMFEFAMEGLFPVMDFGEIWKDDGVRVGGAGLIDGHFLLLHNFKNFYNSMDASNIIWCHFW